MTQEQFDNAFETNAPVYSPGGMACRILCRVMTLAHGIETVIYEDSDGKKRVMDMNGFVEWFCISNEPPNMREYKDIKADLTANIKRQRQLIEEIQDNQGYGLLGFSQKDDETLLVVDYPSDESGTDLITVAMQAMILRDECFNGFNEIILYRPGIFETELKYFFGSFGVDDFSDEQNRIIRKEIGLWIDSLPDEAKDVFEKTVRLSSTMDKK